MVRADPHIPRSTDELGAAPEKNLKNLDRGDSPATNEPIAAQSPASAGRITMLFAEAEALTPS